jgi:hypothetical protein
VLQAGQRRILRARRDLYGVSPTAIRALLKAVGDWRRERRGMLATCFAEVTGFLKLAPDSPRP